MPTKYARDRELCRSTVDDYMKERRNIDNSRREVFRGDYDRYGRGDLPETMANYGDNRSSDRLIERCMEQRGWPAAAEAVVAEDRQLACRRLAGASARDRSSSRRSPPC